MCLYYFFYFVVIFTLIPSLYRFLKSVKPDNTIISADLIIVSYCNLMRKDEKHRQAQIFQYPRCSVIYNEKRNHLLILETFVISVIISYSSKVGEK